MIIIQRHYRLNLHVLSEGRKIRMKGDDLRICKKGVLGFLRDWLFKTTHKPAI
jgi:hypothetical protein